jgi:hypothetical protein
MSQNLSMPTVILRINSVQNQSVINDNRAKIFFSLAVIKSLSVFSDFIQQSLPLVDIVT